MRALGVKDLRDYNISAVPYLSVRQLLNFLLKRILCFNGMVEVALLLLLLFPVSYSLGT